MSNAARNSWEGMTAEARASRLTGLRRRSETNPTQRRYPLNHAFFDVIDSEEKAYWLGFLSGDGAIIKSTVVVALKRGDAAHLTKLATAIESSAPIHEYTSTLGGRVYLTATVRLSSIRLVAALARLGVGPRKSLTLQPWDGPAELLRHYWRGLIDADGHIGRAPNESVELVGSEAVVAAFARFAAETVGTQAACRPHKGIWKCAIAGRVQARALALLLYTDCTVALQRKEDAVGLLIASGPSRAGSADVRAAISASLKGRAPSLANRLAHGTPEARERARQRALGRIASPETRAKMSATHKARAANRH